MNSLLFIAAVLYVCAAFYGISSMKEQMFFSADWPSLWIVFLFLAILMSLYGIGGLACMLGSHIYAERMSMSEWAGGMIGAKAFAIFQSLILTYFVYVDCQKRLTTGP